MVAFKGAWLEGERVDLQLLAVVSVFDLSLAEGLTVSEEIGLELAS